MNVLSQVLPIFAGIGGALSLSTAIGFVLDRRVRDARSRAVIENLNSRIRAWWMIVALTGGALLAGHGALILLFAFVSFAALREFITLTPTRRADHWVLFVSFFVVLPIQYGLIAIGWYGLFSIFIPVYAFLILPILAVLSADSTHFLARMAQTQWGLMISVYCISHIPALLTLSIPGLEDRTALLLLFLILVAQASDILQYVVGKLCGRRKIAPQVSPSKTVEGFAGGVALATLLGACLSSYFPFGTWATAGLALVITLMGFLGGLVMSAIKRDRGVKDWGHMLEGHGGMLDRLDSLCFSAPIFFHLTRYFFSV